MLWTGREREPDLFEAGGRAAVGGEANLGGDRRLRTLINRNSRSIGRAGVLNQREYV